MRMLLTIAIPVAKGNQAIADGTLARIMQDMLTTLTPEAVYLTTDKKQGPAWGLHGLRPPW